MRDSRPDAAPADGLLRRALVGVKNRPQTLLAGVWYLSVAAAGAALLLRSSPWGIGIRVDSLSYLTAAQSLAQGRCLCWLGSGMTLKPLVHFGPAYPALVATLSAVGPDEFEAARIVSSLLFGGNLALAGFVVHVGLRRFWPGVLATSLLAVSPVIVEAHDSAMSEPLFLFLFLSASHFLADYLTGRRAAKLLLACLGIALAVLTRYAGSSLLLTGALAVLLVGGAPWRERLRRTAALALGSALPVLLWLLRNLRLAGTLTNRVFGYHPVTIDDARGVLDTITFWVTPARPSHWIEGAVLAALLAGAGWILLIHASRIPVPRRAAHLGLILLLFLIVYLPMLGISRTYFDAKIPLDDRMLVPWYAAAALLISISFGMVFRGRRSLVVALSLLSLGAIGPGKRMLESSAAILGRLRQTGAGFASRAWRESESMAWVRRLPVGALLYSNKALVIQLLIGRAAYQPPERYDEVKAELRRDYEENLTIMYADLDRPDSYLLLFDPAKPVRPEDFEDDLPPEMVLVLTLEDGVVYRRESSSGSP